MRQERAADRLQPTHSPVNTCIVASNKRYGQETEGPKHSLLHEVQRRQQAAIKILNDTDSAPKIAFRARH